MAAAEYAVSRALFLKIKTGDEPLWRIAQRVGLAPSTVSALIRNYRPVERDDARIIALARAVGLPPERAFARRRIAKNGWPGKASSRNEASAPTLKTLGLAG
jgi:hypothetical protein